MDEQSGEPQSGDADAERSSEDDSPEALENEPDDAGQRAGELPVDQRALNIVGIAQARAYLRAGRAATTRLGRPCPSCGSTLAHVTPADDGPDVIVVCADCSHISFEGPAEQLVLDEPSAPGPAAPAAPVGPDESGESAEPNDRDDLVELADQDELEGSVRRHPATQSRLRRRN